MKESTSRKKKRVHSGGIRPKFYWNVPKGAGYFFTHQSDVAFKSRHPVAYIVLVVIGFIVVLLPMALFILFEGMLFPPGKQGPMTAFGAIVGAIGSLIAGIGLFNVVAAWIQQYLGHWVTLGCLLGGGAMVAVSFWMQLTF